MGCLVRDSSCFACVYRVMGFMDAGRGSLESTIEIREAYSELPLEGSPNFFSEPITLCKHCCTQNQFLSYKEAPTGQIQLKSYVLVLPASFF